MILVLGSSADSVYPKLLANLRQSGHPFVTVDEDHPQPYTVQCDQSNGRTAFRIEGGECQGRHPVTAIFVRHAVARTLDQHHLDQMGTLQLGLNRMLLATPCPIINRPASAYSNYSKPYQVGLLAQAGFDVPKSLVTNIAEEARRFYAACNEQVIFKGVSNVLTLVQVLQPQNLGRLDFLPHSPTLFQEYIAGVDYRVHVVGEQTFVTRLVAQNEDYRRSALIANEELFAEPASLPPAILAKCIAFTKQLGLIVSGIDFKESATGRLVALECNPYPQFTFYESRSGQSITQAVVNYLIQHQITQTNVFA